MTQRHTNQTPDDKDEMLPEYDLENKQGVRGKYYHGTRERQYRSEIACWLTSNTGIQSNPSVANKRVTSVPL